MEISVSAFAARHADGALVVDVREPSEYVEGHVPGAVLMPLSVLPARAAELPRNEPVYVVCQSGGRSVEAVERLRRLGVQAVSVNGGTGAWVSTGRPVIKGAHAAAA